MANYRRSKTDSSGKTIIRNNTSSPTKAITRTKPNTRAKTTTSDNNKSTTTKAMTRPKTKALAVERHMVDFGESFNPQSSCSLFRISAELRNKIYMEVLIAYTHATQENQWDYPVCWMHCMSAPLAGYKKHIDVSLLLTCKLIYIEARRIPVANYQHVFWQGGLRSYVPRNIRFAYDVKSYFNQMVHWQQIDVKDIKLIVSTFNWLGDGNFPDLRVLEDATDSWPSIDDICSLPVLQNVANLTIVVRPLLPLRSYQFNLVRFGSVIGKLLSLKNLVVEFKFTQWQLEEDGDGIFRSDLFYIDLGLDILKMEVERIYDANGHDGFTTTLRCKVKDAPLGK